MVVSEKGGRVGALAHAAFARGPDVTLIRGGLGGGEGREREGGCEERERERETEREHCVSRAPGVTPDESLCVLSLPGLG